MTANSAMTKNKVAGASIVESLTFFGSVSRKCPALFARCYALPRFESDSPFVPVRLEDEYAFLFLDEANRVWAIWRIDPTSFQGRKIGSVADSVNVIQNIIQPNVDDVLSSWLAYNKSKLWC